MSMDAANIQTFPQLVKVALASVHAAVPNIEEQRQAQNFLQQVLISLSVEHALQVATTLFAPLLCPDPSLAWQEPHVQPAVHFGFHVIDDRVLAPGPWDSASEQSQTVLRQLALSLLSTVSSGEAHQCIPAWTRQKVASLLSALALRQWPQYWPDFVETLTGLARAESMPSSQGQSTFRLTVCDTFKILINDVHEFGERISQSRRSELSKALNIALVELVGFVKESAELCYSSGNFKGLSVVLGTVEALLASADFEKVLTAELVSACVVMMKHPAARDSALEALAVFVARKVPVAASAVSVATAPATIFIRDRLFPQLVDFVITSGPGRILVDSFLPVNTACFPAAEFDLTASHGSINPEEHAFNTRIIDMMADVGLSYFGVCYLPYLLTPAELSTPQRVCATRYLEFMLAGIAHPSLAVRDRAMRFFSTVVVLKTREAKGGKRKKGGGKNGGQPSPIDFAHGSLEAASATESGRELLLVLSVGFINAATLGLVDHPSHRLGDAFSEVDFDGDQGEQQEVSAGLRRRIVSCIGNSGALSSWRAMPVALERMAMFVESVSSASSGQVNIAQIPDAPTPSSFVHALPPGQDTRWAFTPLCSRDSSLLQACAIAVVSAAEGVVAGAVSAGRFTEGSTDPGILDRLAAIFDQIVSVSDPRLQGLRVQSFKMFIPVFQRSPERLIRALQVLTSAATDKTDSDVRSRACSSLASLIARLARVDSKALVDVRKQLCEFVAPTLVEPERPMAQKSRLLEAATSCVLTLDTLAEKTTWIEALLRPLTDILAPSTGWCMKAFGPGGAFSSPSALFRFASDSVESEYRREFLTSLCLMQVCTHQVVRESSHSASPLAIPAPLSQSVAPVCAELTVRLIALVHGLYNESRLPAMREPAVCSALLPTCRELTSLIYDDGAYLNAIDSCAIDKGGCVIDADAGARQADLLSRVGLATPDQAHERPRTIIRLLRVGAYELLRNCILSGVMSSPSHVVPVLESICVDYQFLEPIHLYYLLNRVVRVILSHQVVSSAPGFIPSVSDSPVPRMIGRLIEQIESIGANEIVSSSNIILDTGREQGRVRLIRVAGDLISSMFPKPGAAGSSNEVGATASVALPIPLRGDTDLSKVLWALFRTMCGVLVVAADKAASRLACDLLTRVVEKGSEEAGSHYVSLLDSCVGSAVFNFERGGDESAMAAMAAVVQRYPVLGTAYFERVAVNETPAVCKQIGDALSAMVNSASRSPGNVSTQKPGHRQRQARELVRCLAAMRGISAGREKTILVKSIPMAMNAVNPVRSAARVHAQCENEEIILGDAALDSLFGSGEPL